MNFRIKGLSPEPFQHLFGLDDEALTAEGIIRYTAEEDSGLPDRIEMRDAAPGETLLLLNHVCQPAETPYRASHAIFVHEGAAQAYDRVNEVPDMMRVRLLSLRGFSAEGMIVDSDVVEGTAIEDVIERLFANPSVAYIHAHHAKHGCFSGLIERA